MSPKLNIIRLTAGAAVFVAGLFLEHLWQLDRLTVLLPVYIAGFLLLGGDIVFKSVKNILRGKIFDENLLMSLAAIGAFFIGEYAEAAGVALFYQIGELLQDSALRGANKSIAALLDIRPDFANLLQDGEIIKTSPDAVYPGDAVIVKPGEKIPLDGTVLEGESALDCSALTGESLPRSLHSFRRGVKLGLLKGLSSASAFSRVLIIKLLNYPNPTLYIMSAYVFVPMLPLLLPIILMQCRP